MSPNRYTELFFLDEAVALAADHKPCAECCRERFGAFKTAWSHAYHLPSAAFVFADSIDPDNASRAYRQRKEANHLPGVARFFARRLLLWIAVRSCLVWGDCLYRWSYEGYAEKRHRPERTDVEILTPEPSVQRQNQSFLPRLHDSLMAFST
jgi:hypothetical protein